ncbi:MAG: hypothetical protein KKF56_01925 [Nanoarchaeota archaeon]|nr:hypothetical protein [Nanoarchaeota archaeon]
MEDRRLFGVKVSDLFYCFRPSNYGEYCSRAIYGGVEGTFNLLAGILEGLEKIDRRWQGWCERRFRNKATKKSPGVGISSDKQFIYLDPATRDMEKGGRGSL